MSTKKLLALYGLKWNPFSQTIPMEAISPTPLIESFCYSMENLVMDGGYALVTGENGTGKTIVLRSLEARLSEMQELTVASVARPQSNIVDFYREIGELFSIELRASNRWSNFTALRQKWQNHIKASMLRPVLIIDEAQEMEEQVLSELRFLTSSRLDSYLLMSIVLCGDLRLLEKLKAPALVPLGTRIRVRQVMESASKDELKYLLTESIRKAGNASLITPVLINTLAEHSLGNYRVMMNTANTLLENAAMLERNEIDEKLYLDVFHRNKQKPEQRKAITRNSNEKQ
jgi:general secretion pathway protein A